MLRWRFIFGTLFVAALVILCWLDYVVTRPGTFLLPVALMLGWVGVVELLEMFNKRGRMPIPWVVYSGVLIAILLAGISVIEPPAVSARVPGPLGWLTIGIAMGLLLAFLGEVL